MQYPTQPIQPGGFGVLSIGFSPTAVGFRAAQLSILSNDPAGAYEITLRATATEPQIGALSASVDGATVANGGLVELGELELGVEYVVSVELENVGNASMNVFDTNFLGEGASDFERLTDLPLSLNAGAAGAIELSLIPSAEGATNATLRMLNNGTQTPYDVIFSYDVVAVELFDDCNSNGVDDALETDSDGNGIIDDCEVVTPPVDEDPIVVDDPGNDDLDNDGNNDVDNNDNVDDDGNDQDIVDNDNDDNNANDNVVDQNDDNDDLGNNNQDDDRDENREEKRSGFCGAGSIGMLTLTMLGLSGTRVRRRRCVA